MSEHDFQDYWMDRIIRNMITGWKELITRFNWKKRAREENLVVPEILKIVFRQLENRVQTIMLTRGPMQTGSPSMGHPVSSFHGRLLYFTFMICFLDLTFNLA